MRLRITLKRSIRQQEDILSPCYSSSAIISQCADAIDSRGESRSSKNISMLPIGMMTGRHGTTSHIPAAKISSVTTEEIWARPGPKLKKRIRTPSNRLLRAATGKALEEEYPLRGQL